MCAVRRLRVALFRRPAVLKGGGFIQFEQLLILLRF